ncbi:hypothetical protein [Nonomuraea sp. NPDC049709]|uniref:hypothetical protein n=1 Tax=Nonomuraea sp. NPDC049709 TaxID=3154736 RepID=UPI00341E0979
MPVGLRAVFPQPGMIRFRLKGGKIIAVPLAAEVMTLLRPLMTGRDAGDLLLLRADRPQLRPLAATDRAPPPAPPGWTSRS